MWVAAEPAVKRFHRDFAAERAIHRLADAPLTALGKRFVGDVVAVVDVRKVFVEIRRLPFVRLLLDLSVAEQFDGLVHHRPVVGKEELPQIA